MRADFETDYETTYYTSGTNAGRYNLAMLRRLASRPNWQIAMAMTAALRVFYTALVAAAVPFLHPDPALIRSNELTEHLPAPHGLYYALLGVWERFDTLWFLHIAKQGYDRPLAVIFYPLYPMSIRLIGRLMPAVVAALLLSTVAAFFFFWGLMRLAGGLSGVGKLRMLLLISVWPTSFVLFAGYAESLTLALVVWAVIFGREARWPAATICGLLAGMARPSGVLVCIPLTVMALRSRQARSILVALTPLGWLGYWAWLRWSGRVSVVEAYRRYQGMNLVSPWKGLAETLRLIVTKHDSLLAIKLCLVVGVTVVSLRRQAPAQMQPQLRIEDKVFALAVILQMLMYTGRPLLGAARYLLMVYPAFLAWGACTEHWKGMRLGFNLAALGVLNLAWMWAFLNWSLVL
jgi:hypothetical protein